MKHTRKQTHQDGFTLIELLLTIVVLGIAMTGIAGMYYTMQAAQVQSQHLDIATRADRTEIESLRNNGYNALTAGSSINFTSSLPGSLPPDKTGTAAVSEPMPGLKRIDATITYTDYGKTQTIILSSDIGVIGIGEGE